MDWFENFDLGPEEMGLIFGMIDEIEEEEHEEDQIISDFQRGDIEKLPVSERNCKTRSELPEGSFEKFARDVAEGRKGPDDELSTDPLDYPDYDI